MQISKHLVAVLALSLPATYGVAAAETISGVLHKGRTHSSIYTVSDRSGDLIGYLVTNQSRVGKKLLATCVPDMPCTLGGAQTRAGEGQWPDALADHPSGWFDILAFAEATVTSAGFEYLEKASTRFGTVEVNEESGRLFFKGKAVRPLIEANSSLSILRITEAGDRDIVLLQNTGGAACPALYRYVAVSAAGVRATPEFGTCSDLVFPVYDGQNRFAVNMVGFAGPFESADVQTRAARTRHVYHYDINAGIVLEAGKPVE